MTASPRFGIAIATLIVTERIQQFVHPNGQQRLSGRDVPL